MELCHGILDSGMEVWSAVVVLLTGLSKLPDPEQKCNPLKRISSSIHHLHPFHPEEGHRSHLGQLSQRQGTHWTLHHSIIIMMLYKYISGFHLIKLIFEGSYFLSQ